jgi:hypothetical protein
MRFLETTGRRPSLSPAMKYVLIFIYHATVRRRRSLAYQAEVKASFSMKLSENSPSASSMNLFGREPSSLGQSDWTDVVSSEIYHIWSRD